MTKEYKFRVGMLNQPTEVVLTQKGKTIYVKTTDYHIGNGGASLKERCVRALPVFNQYTKDHSVEAAKDIIDTKIELLEQKLKDLKILRQMLHWNDWRV